ncbi:hypothetical protein OXX69_009267 [Metschnikowia pulcherrima]
MSLNQTHKALVRENLRKTNETSGSQRKRRKVNVPAETVDVDSESTDDFEDVDLENVDLEALATTGRASIEPTPIGENSHNDEMTRNMSDENSGSEFDSDDFDDLEDVDMDMFSSPANDKSNETLTFNISNGQKEAESAKKKRTFVPISKHERKTRKLVHKLVLFAMVCHGAVRNKWCSDQALLQQLRKSVSAEIVDLFHQDEKDVLDYVKAKKFIDGLRKLSTVFSRKFKVSSPGITRKDWGSTEITEDEKEKKVTFDKFMKSVRGFRGSRDVAAQAFVAVLRSIGVNARLVFSVQVPDYRSIRPVKDKSKDEREPTPAESPSKPKSEFDPVFIPNSRQALLSGIRSRKKKAAQKAQAKKTESAASFPIFWIEVWNKYSKKWITVDPVVFKVVEVAPMRRKCKFDAPGTDETHQTWYVIAYDHKGCLTDVTRRYTQYYNAKTAKRRIGFASEEDAHWYGRMLRAVGRPKSSITQAEATELKEFHDRHICEGTPNNMADFKNHPVYALEPQLRQDEIIYPKDETSKCGTFRSSNKSSVMPVYKRSCVYKLKTPKAWHMSGRVLKVGAQPLKTKKAQVQFADEDGDDDGQVRLYAEFQTELYIPPPIVDGNITKNVYGNVEIFRPWMVPENGYLVPVSRDVSMKMLETAARWILNIDYAKAIVSFEFGKGQKTKRAPTAKEGGVLIDEQYRDGMLAVIEGLKEQEEQQRREAVELNALRSWNFFLKKLQIVKRLDRSHGKVDGEESGTKNAMQVDDEDDEGYYSVGSDDANSDNDAYTPRPTKRTARQTPSEDDLDDVGGGFLMEDSNFGEGGENTDFTDGGFSPEETSVNVSMGIDGSGERVDSQVSNEAISDNEECSLMETDALQDHQNLNSAENVNSIRSEEDVSELAPGPVEPKGEIPTGVLDPNGKTYPRARRSQLRASRTAEYANSGNGSPNMDMSVINLDSDESGDHIESATRSQVPKAANIRRSSRSAARAGRQRVSEADAYIDLDTDDEEAELEIEYSDDE